jgi:hypothetical protein
LVRRLHDRRAGRDCPGSNLLDQSSDELVAPAPAARPRCSLSQDLELSIEKAKPRAARGR